MIKKVLYLISLLALTLMPGMASAHYSGETNPSDCSIGIRVEASKDNGTTWYSYDSSDAASLGTGYTLSIRPGDSIKIRVKVWNEGVNTCLVNVTDQSTGFAYLNTSGIIDNLDEDGDAVSFLPPPSGISPTANMLANGASATSGYQAFSIDATVKSDAPANTTVSLGYSVTSVSAWLAQEPSTRSFVQNIVSKLIPTAHADGDGTATSEMRMQVASATTPPVTVTELPKTGSNTYLFFIPVLLTLPIYLILRRKHV